MAEIWTMGDLLVEIMRTKEDSQLYDTDIFKGPYPSGAPGIFISTVARLGHKAAVIGGVGKDDFAKNLIGRLEKDGVDCRYVKKSEEASTGVAFVTYFKDGSRKYLFHMGMAANVESPDLKEEDFKDAKYFHIMGVSLMAKKEFGEAIIETMKKFVSHGAKVSFDPNIRLELMHNEYVFQMIQDVLGEASVFLPGVEELQMLMKEDDVETAVKLCFERNPKLEYLVLKCGSKGAKYYGRQGLLAEIGAYHVESVDPTGAGDSFDGAFLCGLLEGKSLEEAGKMASAAGALNVAAFGPMEGNISPKTIAEMIAKGTDKE